MNKGGFLLAPIHRHYSLKTEFRPKNRHSYQQIWFGSKSRTYRTQFLLQEETVICKVEKGE